MSKNFTSNQKVWDAADRKRSGVAIGRSANDPHLVAVEWEDGELTRVHEDNLLSEDDMALELEFKAINDKLAEAARLFSEAAKAANAKGVALGDYNYDTEEELFPAVNDLFRTMRNDAGWSTSSLSC